MTRKEQIKILDNKIKSNINQYKIDRLNAEISAFSSGDLNKYEFLTRKDLKYKPNALDKARFEFSPLVKTFSTGLDKTAKGYQEEGVIKLLKDIGDGLACGIIRQNNRPNRPNNDDNDDKDDNDNDDNDDDNDDDDNDNDGNDNDNDGNDDNDDDDNDDDKNKKIQDLMNQLKDQRLNDGDKNKIYDMLDKFKNDMENNMNNLYKKVIDKENNISIKLNKLNNKINNYVGKNNNKKVDTKKN